MSVIKDVMAAACVAGGMLTLGGALFLGAGGTAQAVPKTGTCILTAGGGCVTNTNDPCSGKCGFDSNDVCKCQ